MSQWTEILVEMIGSHTWLAPLLCVLAGIVTSLTPCSLATVPSVLAYVGASSRANTGKALRLSLVMALGMAATFGIFGSVASAIGHAFHDAGHWWSVLLGVLMILMALQIWDVIHLIPHVHMEGNPSLKGYTGAFLVGMLNGLFASHCATPVMIALLALVARMGGSTVWAIFLMALYAAGHSVLLVAAGTGYSAVERFLEDPHYGRISACLKTILGAVIFVIGVLLFFVGE